MNTKLCHVILVCLFLTSATLGLGQYVGNSPYCPEHGGLLINEISNGISGNANEEYIELLVVGAPDNPTASVDVSGWIIDDNNAPNSGQGTAQGHLTLGDCYSSLSAGNLLIIYNADDRNPSLPPDDPMDSDGDGVYIIPHTSSCLIACNSNPSADNSAATNPNPSDYCPCLDPDLSIPSWPLGMRNAGDVLQVRDRCTSVVHAIHWGTVDVSEDVANAPTRIHFDESQSGRVIVFNNGDWNVAANWDNLDFSGNETPGRANNAANEIFIADIQNAGACTGTIDNCDEADAGDLLFPEGQNSTPIQLCRGEDLLAFAPDYSQNDELEPDAAGFNFEYAYILTTPNPPYFIIDFNRTGDFDFTDATGNRYLVWGLSYLHTSGLMSVLDFLTNEVVSIEAIEVYEDCGLFKDLDNRTVAGDVMEIIINELPEVFPIEFELCEEENGQISFNLQELALFIAYEQDSVIWYTDIAGRVRIDDSMPFVSGDNLIFAEVYLGGCASEPVNILIDVVNAPTISADIQEVNCDGTNEASVTLNIEGEQTPYYVNWPNDDWDGLTTIDPIPSGSYEVTIVDAGNFCVNTFNFEVSEPNLLSLDCIGTSNATIGQNDGVFNFSFSGGTPPYTLTWGAGLSREQSESGDGSITDLAAGMYTFIITDTEGCTQQCDFNVEGSNCTNTRLIEETLCFGEALEIDGTIYDALNPTGSIFIPAEMVGECDSLININLSFRAEAIEMLDFDLCLDGSIEANGTIYDIDNPSGMELLNTSTGCDSTIIIDLNFTNLDSTFIQETLCVEESLTINGTIYNAANTSGIEVLSSVNSNCDSVVVIDLSFVLPNLVIDTLLCEDGFLELNGRRFDRDNPTGTQIFSDASVSGCDSIININLRFAEPVEAEFSPILCAGETITINGNTYNADVPEGTEILLGASSMGCDSTVHIALQFEEEITSTVQETLCVGESLLINGTTYNQDNPSGTERLLAAGANGCDSIVMIDLSFHTEARLDIIETLCMGEAMILNGMTYDENTPEGTEILIGASSTGCDSTIVVNLSFYEEVRSLLAETLCEKESLQVGEQVFSTDNPSGTVTLANANINGCDSIVDVQLAFVTQDTSRLTTTLCADESIVINGTSYDQSNPTGMELIASDVGCDSLIFINLSFTPPISVLTSSEAPTCVEDSDGTLRIENVTGGTSPYTLFLNENSRMPDNFPIQFSNLAAGQYALEIEDAAGCVRTQTIEVASPEAVIVNLGEDLFIDLGDSIQIASTISDNVLDWEWASTDFLSSPTALSTFAMPPRSTVYTLTVYDEEGCSASDQIRIIVNLERNVFVPNIFSPNEDGVNDFLTVYADGKVQNVKLFQIFDRWGNLIFENSDFLPNNPQAGWNGFVNGKLIHSGIYVYTAEIEFSDNTTEIFSGEVMLMY